MEMGKDNMERRGRNEVKGETRRGKELIMEMNTKGLPSNGTHKAGSGVMTGLYHGPLVSGQCRVSDIHLFAIFSHVPWLARRTRSHFYLWLCLK